MSFKNILHTCGQRIYINIFVGRKCFLCLELFLLFSYLVVLCRIRMFTLNPDKHNSFHVNDFSRQSQ